MMSAFTEDYVLFRQMFEKAENFHYIHFFKVNSQILFSFRQGLSDEKYTHME